MKNFVYPEFLNGLIRGDFDFGKDSFKIVLIKPDLLDSDVMGDEYTTYESIRHWECKGAENVGTPYAEGGADIAFALETVDNACRLVIAKNSSKNSIIKLGGVDDPVRWAFVYRKNAYAEPEVKPEPETKPEPENPPTVPEENVPEVASLAENEASKLLMCFDLASGASGIQASGANIDLNFNDFAVEIRNA